MKNKALEETLPMISERWGKEKCSSIEKFARQRLEKLCLENSSDSKAVKVHTQSEIFPCISLYEAIQHAGIPASEALKFLDESWSRRAKAGAKSLKQILSFGGLYKLYPAIFRAVARKQYGSAAGFEARFYHCGKQHCKFDMTRCLFLETCRRYGCPELTKCFCHVDDINNSGLHPRLCWNRTKFMGDGGDFCDFDIFVTGKKS